MRLDETRHVNEDTPSENSPILKIVSTEKKNLCIFLLQTEAIYLLPDMKFSLIAWVVLSDNVLL